MSRSVQARRLDRPIRTAILASLAAVLLGLARPTPATAQFEAPCELTCIGVLGATGFVTATGVAVAYGRITGGISSIDQAIFIWGGSFAAVVGGGMALSGDGGRQERAVYAAGIGTAAGAVTGLLIEAVRTGGDEAHLFAGTLIGAAVGTLAGGVYGALSYDDEPNGTTTIPLLTLTAPF